MAWKCSSITETAQRAKRATAGTRGARRYGANYLKEAAGRGLWHGGEVAGLLALGKRMNSWELLHVGYRLTENGFKQAEVLCVV